MTIPPCKEMYLDVLETLDNGKQYTRKEVANINCK